MNELQMINFIKSVVREQLASIFMAQITANADQNRSTFTRFASDSPIPNARNIQPYGISSRAPVSTPCLTVPINSDPSHINIVGHYDENRTSLNDGEVAMYNAYGQLIYLSNGKIQIGTKSADQNLVLGQIFKSFCDSLLTAIADHVHTGNLGYPTSPPTNASVFTGLQSSPIDDESILSQVSFTE